MSDDLLEAATRALRDEAESAPDGHFTRARVMASLHQGKIKRRTRLAFALPLAACLAGGTAWGAATGRLPAVFHALSQAVSYEREAPAQPSPPRPAQGALQPAPRHDEPAASEPAVSQPALDEPAVGKPKPVPSAGSSASSLERAPSLEAEPRAAPSASAAFQDADGDLYRLAHEAHFVQQNYARALAGWDAYLRAAPGGRLATEARYNRAICLLRLGREEEAKRALQPFASGMLGYRQSEARQLLDELSRERE